MFLRGSLCLLPVSVCAGSVWCSLSMCVCLCVCVCMCVYACGCLCLSVSARGKGCGLWFILTSVFCAACVFSMILLLSMKMKKTNSSLDAVFAIISAILVVVAYILYVRVCRSHALTTHTDTLIHRGSLHSHTSTSMHIHRRVCRHAYAYVYTHAFRCIRGLKHAYDVGVCRSQRQSVASTD